MNLRRRAVLVAGVGAAFVACTRRTSGPDMASPVATIPPTTDPVPTSSPTVATTEPPATSPPPEPTPTLVPVTAALLCRSAWGAADAGADDERHTPTRVTVHHTAAVFEDNRRAPSRWRGYQRFHQDQGWSDIAYHVGVDREGNLYELRHPDVPGDTFTDYDPAGHHLIVADGNFEEQAPTAAQVEAVAQAAAAACARYGVDPATIGGHRDHASTSCPGTALYDLLPAIRTRAAELLDAGIDVVTVCGDEADARIAAIEA